MVKTLEYAKKKWEEKTKAKGKVWKAHVTDKAKVFASNMAKFLGIPAISTEKEKAWSEGVGRVAPEDFNRAVEGKGAKWASRIKEAFTPL